MKSELVIGICFTLAGVTLLIWAASMVSNALGVLIK